MQKLTIGGADTFKDNLKAAIEKSGESLRQVADRAGVPYGWLRRVTSRGLTPKPNGGFSDNIDRLALALGLSDTRQLWRYTDEAKASDVIEKLKRDYPAQWALLVAWCWQQDGCTNGDELAEKNLLAGLTAEAEANQDKWLPELARRLADEISDKLQITMKNRENFGKPYFHDSEFRSHAD